MQYELKEVGIWNVNTQIGIDAIKAEAGDDPYDFIYHNCRTAAKLFFHISGVKMDDKKWNEIAPPIEPILAKYNIDLNDIEKYKQQAIEKYKQQAIAKKDPPKQKPDAKQDS